MSILNLLDRPIAYHRPFAAIAGSICAGVFLSQAFYWSQRTSDPDGWFWKTQEQWFDETFMTRYEQETARKKLVAIGVLEQKKQGIPAKLFYRIDRKVLEVKMQEYADKYAGIQHTGVMDSNIQARGKPTNILYTENTSEITQREEEAHSQKPFSESEEDLTQDPISTPSPSLSIKQINSADDGETSSETASSAAPILPPQKNNATANFEKRFANPRKYPELDDAGHGNIMIGKGLLDFDPTLVEVAALHLKKHELACEVVDAKRFISNRIRQSDWAAIELLKEAAIALVSSREKFEAAIASSESFDTSRYCIQSEPPQIDLEEREREAKAGIAKMRASFLDGQKKRVS